MNNLLSYCGLVDAKIRASDKDLPVRIKLNYKIHTFIYFFHFFIGDQRWDLVEQDYKKKTRQINFDCSK